MSQTKKAQANVNKGRMQIVAVIAILAIGIWGLHSMGLLPEAFYSAVGIDRDKPGTVGADAEQVDLSIKTLHALDRGNPAATPIRVYDADMNFIESASTSSGIATFSAPYWEGETIYLQARAAAPNDAAYVTYTTPLLQYTVPEGDVNGDAELPILQLWETSTTAAYYNVTDQNSAAIYTEATQFVNTTDTSLNVLVTITADCVYGTPEDFTDYDTGKHYLAGVWLVLKATASQATITNYVAHFYSASLEWYIFKIPMIVYDSDLGYQTGRMFTIGDGSTVFTASADFDFDLYDTCWANSVSDISSSSFMNGDSDLNPASLANKVA
jgi:hypothetical protein